MKLVSFRTDRPHARLFDRTFVLSHSRARGRSLAHSFETPRGACRLASSAARGRRFTPVPLQPAVPAGALPSSRAELTLALASPAALPLVPSQPLCALRLRTRAYAPVLRTSLIVFVLHRFARSRTLDRFRR